MDTRTEITDQFDHTAIIFKMRGIFQQFVSTSPGDWFPLCQHLEKAQPLKFLLHNNEELNAIDTVRSVPTSTADLAQAYSRVHLTWKTYARGVQVGFDFLQPKPDEPFKLVGSCSQPLMETLYRYNTTQLECLAYRLLNFPSAISKRSLYTTS